jgi:hypothetical protein
MRLFGKTPQKKQLNPIRKHSGRVNDSKLFSYTDEHHSLSVGQLADLAAEAAERKRESTRLFSFDIPNESRLDPTKQELDYMLGKRMQPGLNIRFRCLSKKCFRYHEEVIAIMGMINVFDLNLDSEKAKCPVCSGVMVRSALVELEFVDCVYRLSGKKKKPRTEFLMDKQRSTGYGHSHVVDATNWELLKIETSVLKPESRIFKAMHKRMLSDGCR